MKNVCQIDSLIKWHFRFARKKLEVLMKQMCVNYYSEGRSSIKDSIETALMTSKSPIFVRLNAER